MSENTTPVPDARGWPDAQRPGVPLNPEKDGWHILGYPDGGWGAFAWDAKRCTWWVVDQEAPPACIHACYLGPCLTLAQVDAAAEAVRVAALGRAALLCQQIGDSGTAEDCESAIRTEIGIGARCSAVDALAQQIAAAVEAEREAIAGVLREMRDRKAEERTGLPKTDPGEVLAATVSDLVLVNAINAIRARGTTDAEAKWRPLPYETPMDMWKAFRAGTRFVLHYHGKTYPVEGMEPHPKVVYVKPPAMPVKVYADGRSAEGTNPAIWLEQIKATSITDALAQQIAEAEKRGAGRMRERCAAQCDALAAYAKPSLEALPARDENRMLWYGRHQYAAECAKAIRALPSQEPQE